MRAFMEHRGHYGLLGLKPRFTLYLDLQFSNEERAIVLSRALQNYVFDLSPGFLASSESRRSPNAAASIQSGGFLVFILGVVGMFVAAFVRQLETVVMLSLIGGVCLFWLGVAARRHESAGPTKAVTVGYLVSNPSIAVQTNDPAHATILEDNLRKRLTKLKDFLTDTHELTTPRAFEY